MHTGSARPRHGFTLVELLVVVAIMIVLAALVLVNPHGEVMWWLRRAPGYVTDASVLDNGNLLVIDRD